MRTLLLGVILPALAYLLLHFTVLDRSPQSQFQALGIDPAAIDIDTVSPQLAKQLGVVSTQPATEVVAVVISSSFCQANEVEGFHEAVAAIPRLVRNQTADQSDVITRFVGVAVDVDPETGTDYLLNLAEFDEVIGGGSWLNTATEKYMWGSYAIEQTIPQVILLRRTVTRSTDFVVLEESRLLDTIVGADRIIEWVNRGAPAFEPAPEESTR